MTCVRHGNAIDHVTAEQSAVQSDPVTATPAAVANELEIYFQITYSDRT